MIRVQALRKSFGEVTAVAGLDLEVEEGEILGLLGPNGAGKSTTIGMMVGVVRPDSGSIDVGGLGPPSGPEARQLMGVAPQRLSLYEELSGIENLRFFARYQGVSPERLAERVAWALAFAGLEEKAGKRVRGYSGGMQRRLNLACAVIHEPRLLFLDEPTAGVDPQSRARLFDSIEELKATGVTIVYTTHHMEEAERLCDRVAIMDHGRILDLGRVADLIGRHGGASRVEARLAAAPPAAAVAPGPIEGDRLTFTSNRALEDLLALGQAGWQLADFKVTQPNLETVFMELTGRRLRD
ncbi:MAG: ABC transporter ATP-binding protein [Planctomycetes bacterium]|nr:ABC transporter ATP-binding protein [Planctomycetota bacterium]